MKSNFNKLFLKNSRAFDSAGKPKNIHELSNGVCFYWAYCFSKVFGGKLVTVLNWERGEDFYGHAVVKIRNRYFDSEHPHGVEIHLIDAWNENSKVIIHPTITSFMRKWRFDREVYKGKPVKDIFDDTVSRIKKSSNG